IQGQESDASVQQHGVRCVPATGGVDTGPEQDGAIDIVEWRRGDLSPPGGAGGCARDRKRGDEDDERSFEPPREGSSNRTPHFERRTLGGIRLALDGMAPACTQLHVDPYVMT